MKQFVEDSIEFVFKVLTYVSPSLYVIFAAMSLFVAHIVGVNTPIGGVVITLNVIHILVSSYTINNANDIWDFEMEGSLINASIILTLLAIVIYFAELDTHLYIKLSFVINWVVLLINTVTSNRHANNQI